MLTFDCLVCWMLQHVQNTLIQEGKEMTSVLYTYRSCVKALPQVNCCFILSNFLLYVWHLASKFLRLSSFDAHSPSCFCDWNFKMMLQLPDSMKQSQADLYLETYQVLDLEMSRLREIQRWQASAASKVRNIWNFFFILSWSCS